MFHHSTTYGWGTPKSLPNPAPSDGSQRAPLDIALASGVQALYGFFAETRGLRRGGDSPLCHCSRRRFRRNWRDQQTIGRYDPSVGNTSRLTEPERAALIDAIVLRLQKPMSEHGYDDERIREIASTTRMRFVDVGADKPLLFATSLGLEGGCDAMSNCPLWIFRHSDDGYVSVVDAVAASYTVQPTRTNGFFDLVLTRHESPTETHLSVYTYADGKYSDTGCYTAAWPASKDAENQDPDITACKAEEANPAQSESASPKPQDSAPAKTDDSKSANSDNAAALKRMTPTQLSRKTPAQLRQTTPPRLSRKTPSRKTPTQPSDSESICNVLPASCPYCVILSSARCHPERSEAKPNGVEGPP